jgi:hypothetical protein
VDSDRVRVEFVDQKIDQVYLTLPQYIRTTVTVYSGGASAESKQGRRANGPSERTAVGKNGIMSCQIASKHVCSRHLVS